MPTLSRKKRFKLIRYLICFIGCISFFLSSTALQAVCPPSGSGFVINGTTVVDSEGCTISTKGKSKPGVDINAGAGSFASLILGAADNTNRSSITTNGNDSEGVFARGNSSVILYHTDIITSNPHSPALYIDNENGGFAEIQLNDGSISTTSNDGHGALIQGNNDPNILSGQITINNSVVNVSGPNAIGLLIENGRGNLIFNNSSLTTQANFSHGAWASSPGATISINNSQVTTNGNGALGALLNGFALVSISNSTITTNEKDAYVLSSDVNAGQIGIFNIDNSQLTSRKAATISTAGSGLTLITLNTVTNNTGNNEFLRATQSGSNGSNVNLFASNSTLTGDTIVNNRNTVNMFLLNNTTYTGAMAALDRNSTLNVVVDPSQWTINGNSIVTNLINAGNIIFSSPISTEGPYKPLLVQGNYTGNNGNMLFNTVLDGDFSPSDLFLFNSGTASGNTNFVINNQNGQGDLTYNNGILIVKAFNGASTDPNAFFTFDSVEAGPFVYNLYQGGVNGSDPQSWYLRSTVFMPDPPIDIDLPVFPTHPIILPGEPSFPIFIPDPGFPIEPPTIIPPIPDPIVPPNGGVIQFPPTSIGSPDSGFIVQIPPIPIAVANVGQVNIFGLPVGYFPNFRPIVSLYSAIPSIGLLYSQMILDTLHRRVGEQEQLFCSSNLPQRCNPNGGWIRLGSNSGRRINGTIFRRGPDFKYHNQAIQFGVDLYHDQSLENIGEFFGIFGAVGESNASVKNIFNLDAGRVDYSNYSGGLYYTNYNPIGYFDAVAQLGHNSIKSIDKFSRNPFPFRTHGKNWGLSFEAGVPVTVMNCLELEPQAQISYQKLHLRKARGLFVEVGFERTRSVLGRLGLRLKRSIEQENYVITPWIAANLIREFQGNSYTTFSYRRGVLPIPSSLRGNSASLELGLSALIYENASLYASYNRQYFFSNKRSYSNSGHVGIRVNL